MKKEIYFASIVAGGQVEVSREVYVRMHHKAMELAWYRHRAAMLRVEMQIVEFRHDGRGPYATKNR